MKKDRIFIIIGLLFVVLAVVVIFLSASNKKTITYSVIFQTEGGSLIESQEVEKNDYVTKPSHPKRKGYTFVGWFCDGKIYDFSQEVSSDLVLVAKWEKKERTNEEEKIETYTVTFDSDGGTTISSQTVEDGKKATKPTDPVKNGYSFKGWMLDGVIYSFDENVEKDIVLKAKWEKEKEKDNNNNNNNNNNNTNTSATEKFKVNFNSNGGSSVSSQTVEKGKKATKPNNPTRSGYNFVSWQLDGNNYDFNSPVTSNITLVAQWTAKSNYTVTFDSNGGSAVNAQTVLEGNRAIQPSVPTKTGHRFAGWLLNGNAYNFNTAVTSNITLVANWTQKSYSISAVRVDAYSPDSILSVYEEGAKITFQTIKYSDGTYLCSGSNPTVNTGDIEGETRFIVVLSDGTEVSAVLG